MLSIVSLCSFRRLSVNLLILLSRSIRKVSTLKVCLFGVISLLVRFWIIFLD